VANPPQILYTRTGVVLGISHGLLALSVLPVWLSLQRLSESELRAARVHGARPLDVLRDLVVPASLPGVVVGVFFTFVLTLGYYVTPKMLGGRDGLMLAALVDQYVNNLGDQLGAAVLSLLLFGLCLPFILLTPYMLNLLERRT
jgi:ABC-type spermidine/putrescine transport system permease subunit I